MIVQKDPTAPRAGDYKLTGVTSYTINGVVSSAPVSGTLTVFVGEDSKTYYFLEKTSSYQIGYTVKCTGEKFIIGYAQESTKYGNTIYYGVQSGDGRIETNRIEINRYAKPNSVGIVSPTGERIVYTMPIQKHVHIEASQ
ncbi:hypothetical protein GCM10028810_07990 [Spirosoma litoris]